MAIQTYHAPRNMMQTLTMNVERHWEKSESMSNIFEDKLGDRLAYAMIVIAILMVVTAVLQYQYAEAYYPNPRDYPEAFPSFQYYDNKQAITRASGMIGYIPEPLPLFWINNLPRTVSCDSWVEVSGHVPYNEGVLFSKIFKWLYTDEGDRYGRQVAYSNLSYQTQYELQNYVYVPCTGEGLYDFQFHYYHTPTIKYGTDLGSGTSLGYVYHFDVEVRP